MNHARNLKRTAELTVLVLFAALPATAEVNVPFKSTFEGSETGLTELPWRYIQGEVTGNASHLGRFTLEYDLDVWVPALASTGTAELIAANGDRLFADVAGQATEVDPDHVSIIEIYTITDGTGRFQGASGSFLLLRSLVRSTGATGGSFEGTLVLPRGK